MKSARKAAKANADYQKTMAFMEEKEKAKEKAKEEKDNPPKEEELRGEGEQVRRRPCFVSPSLSCCPLPCLFTGHSGDLKTTVLFVAEEEESEDHLRSPCSVLQQSSKKCPVVSMELAAVHWPLPVAELDCTLIDPARQAGPGSAATTPAAASSVTSNRRGKTIASRARAAAAWLRGRAHNRIWRSGTKCQLSNFQFRTPGTMETWSRSGR